MKSVISVMLHTSKMDFSLFQSVLCATLFALIMAPEVKAGEDITTCCSTEDGCCGPDWELHCCNFVAKICCYGEERVHALHHHNHRRWNRHWLQVTLYIMLLLFLVSGVLLCCKGRRRPGKTMNEYTILPGYEYSSPQNILSTAPELQTFQATGEFPLIDYRNGQPRGHSLNANQMAPPPPYYEAA